MPTNKIEIRARIEAVRATMASEGIFALLIPSSDPHVTEYVPARWLGRAWLSGFTGSMGMLLVTQDKAYLLTASLYRLQATAQIEGTGVELYDTPLDSFRAFYEWVDDVLPKGATLAVDGDVLPYFLAKSLQERVAAVGAHLCSDIDLLDSVWHDRPDRPRGAIYALPEPQATPKRSAKLEDLRRSMADEDATHHLISSLDDIAWLCNLRGTDVSCTPTFMAHLLIDPDGGRLFVNHGSIDIEVEKQLKSDGIQIAPYEATADALAHLGDSDVLLIDPRKVTLGFVGVVGQGCRIVEANNPTTMAKSCKTAEELEHFREAMAEDGAAMCEFYAWFERALDNERITELTIDERLTAERARRSGFVSLSFPTIAGFNGNGAMPHYSATADSFSVIEGDGLLLIDSGGQYHGGTTDITRTWQIGDITPAMKRDFTLVLKANISLTSIRFPRDTLSTMLDAIARIPLWSEGIDYAHGTGHGVGYGLCVHEGPHTFRQAIPEPQMALKPGMVTSIEPAVYREGQWGVRIENLVANVPAETSEGDTFNDFLEFEVLTMCPIDTRCIDRTLLREDEAEWLNQYHATVFERLSPLLSNSARDWLLERTQAI